MKGAVMIRCEALKFKSGKSFFYLCLIKAKELISEKKIDAYDAIDNKAGYQRKIQKSRARKFANYLIKCSGNFNGTVLLNVRENFNSQFKQLENHVSGTLEINDDIYVVDGQHRIEGLEIAIKEGYNKEFLVPAIVTLGKDRNHEALSFLIVNRTAKGIKTDLTDELIYKAIPKKFLTDDLKEALSLTRQQTVAEFSIDVTKRINGSKDSLWFDRIALPEQPMAGNKMVRQRTFYLALAEAIKSCGALKRAVNIGDMDSVIQWLKDYWEAVAEICPHAVSIQKAKKYVLLKAVGVSVMNKLFGRVLDYAGKEPSKADFIEVLKRMESLDDAAWRSQKGAFAKQGTNKEAMERIYNHLELELDKV